MPGEAVGFQRPLRGFLVFACLSFRRNVQTTTPRSGNREGPSASAESGQPRGRGGLVPGQGASHRALRLVLVDIGPFAGDGTSHAGRDPHKQRRKRTVLVKPPSIKDKQKDILSCQGEDIDYPQSQAN